VQNELRKVGDMQIDVLEPMDLRMAPMGTDARMPDLSGREKGRPGGSQQTFILTTVAVLLVVAGCSRTGSTSAITHPLDGEWLITSLNGKPLASGSEATVVYHGECGCTSFDTHGNQRLASVIDSSNVKPLFDQYRGGPLAPGVDEVTLSQGSLELRLKRSGPVRQRHTH
jgi:hypothetical protein